ncbi:hypothetical protein [Loktanella sp. 3ANDIMAR09]|uniref:hypothetical protein n=1 Tax=Loktanella sp. 3ANDIMAR09 TaxID=1225657 RepID=UPI000A5D793C|nr:hypothetical protein [Loktanella sp. 3ANDIMAR09]
MMNEEHEDRLNDSLPEHPEWAQEDRGPIGLHFVYAIVAILVIAALADAFLFGG